MGKANKVKGELLDSIEMVNLLQTLKDVADNKFFTLTAQKYKFRRFGETFVEFFRMANFTKVSHPMVSNKNPTVGIIVITVEGSFLGEFNNKIMRRAIEEMKVHPQARFIAVGEKSVDRLKEYTPDLKAFTDLEGTGLYEMAIAIKDYVSKEVLEGRMGKVLVVYSWPKSFETQKARVVQLLPCEDLVSKQSEIVDIFQKVIEESDPKDIITYLTNLWITTRIFEILMDTIIASAAAQASFLEDSVDKMKKERTKVRVKYRKAKKGDIDKSLRETFSARMMTIK